MKGVLKVSKEQVIEIERYCDERGITRRQRIDELGLNCTAYTRKTDSESRAEHKKRNRRQTRQGSE